MRRERRPRSRLRRLCPLAVLRGQVPLLRLQLAMSATSRRTRRASPPPSPARSRRSPTRAPGRTVIEHLPRRRHAVADGAGDGRRASSTRSPRTGRSRRMPRSRSRPTRRASRRSASAAIAPPASTASRSASRRSNDADLSFLGRLHNVAEALRARSRLARATFPRLSFDLIYARPGQTPGGWAAELKRGARRSPPTTSRSTSSPSRTGRPSPRSTAPAS